MSDRAPVRTCVGCGGRAPQPTLVRIAVTAAGLALDRERRLPGRGGYLHRDPGCWRKFVDRRGPVRSLRATPLRTEREGVVRVLSDADINAAR